jgi:hypothetical protein
VFLALLAVGANAFDYMSQDQPVCTASPALYRGAKVIVVVYDVLNKQSRARIDEWVQTALNDAEQPRMLLPEKTNEEFREVCFDLLCCRGRGATSGMPVAIPCLVLEKFLCRLTFLCLLSHLSFLLLSSLYLSPRMHCHPPSS